MEILKDVSCQLSIRIKVVLFQEETHIPRGSQIWNQFQILKFKFTSVPQPTYVCTYTYIYVLCTYVHAYTYIHTANKLKK